MIATGAGNLIHRLMIKRRLSLLVVIFIFSGLSRAGAQDEARPVWQVTNFDITVNNPGAERALNARAIVSVRQLSTQRSLEPSRPLVSAFTNSPG